MAEPEPTIIERSVGDIQFEATVEERHEDTLTITEHPVEKGAAISDHAYKNPTQVTIVAGTGGKGGESVPRETYDKLLELQSSREPFNIATGKRDYENMLLQSVSVSTDADTENILSVVLDCREGIIVSTETAQVPASQQAQAAKTQKAQQSGTKQAQDNSGESENGEDTKKQSILKSVLG
jgi:hypothetical protein